MPDEPRPRVHPCHPLGGKTLRVQTCSSGLLCQTSALQASPEKESEREWQKNGERKAYTNLDVPPLPDCWDLAASWCQRSAWSCRESRLNRGFIICNLMAATSCASGHAPCNCMVSRTAVGKEERLADNQRFCQFLAAHNANTAHNSRDPNRVVGNFVTSDRCCHIQVMFSVHSVYCVSHCSRLWERRIHIVTAEDGTLK